MLQKVCFRRKIYLLPLSGRQNHITQQVSGLPPGGTQHPLKLTLRWVRELLSPS